ncbi:MAG: FAD-binding oxidoreductase [Hoeflea sp.]|uniref:NAD(P)/FAD-dependent oxidoreductase n=1 Tax=Hoeflea sp. TaxID=1940281 RepID=UPI001D246B0D|nr:FAD-dependent oxidoreductase [Hoeflea sp.]MBU4529663.1 FAD-binding oxidoreductase [Alphaproteobacteria bacterium]MBU4546782.1 FAD-binding oxidoreductase [Alphaproteobacteria bacterium]MBU4551050.1 FAD-binding oxidoreductase [Alphaproteobacteria bacterium]MBV1723992.1 FAD-binding oxidoreductase [Hoeflea sp.]MBV1763269.1 FAD-binding oxidoreductase [Hoeflea sp.]
MASHSIIIIGAGIVGACIAHRLSRTGAKVTLIESGEAPGLGVSAASFGWITTAAGDPDLPEDLYRQRLQAIDDYTALDREFGGRLLAPCKGAIVWGASEDETLDWADRHADRGSTVRLLGAADVTELEPMIAKPPALAAHFPREKAVDVSHACVTLLRAASDSGTDIILAQEVLSLEAEGGRVTGVRVSDRIIAADRVIVAAGAGSADIVAGVMPDHGITTSPSALVTLGVNAGRLSHVVDGGGIEIRSRANGDLVAACSVKPGDDDQEKQELASDVLSKVRRFFPGMENPRVEKVEIGLRPFVADGRPLVSTAQDVDGLCLAVAHPGVILAPEISRQVAELLAH